MDSFDLNTYVVRDCQVRKARGLREVEERISHKRRKFSPKNRNDT